VREFLEREHGSLIDGQFAIGDSDELTDIVDPGSGVVLSRAAYGNQQSVDRAVEAARRALDEGPWSRMSPSDRAKLMWRIADLLEERAEVFGQLETLDQGKPLRIARDGDVAVAVETFRYMAGWATKLLGDTIPVGAPGTVHAYTQREPVGVVGQIVPWNFPLAMAAWKLAPALAAGCTCVLKPADQTPLTAMLLGELAIEAGFPAGVINIIPGTGAEVGNAIVTHAGIDKVAFTGSTAVGKGIVRSAADDLKRVSLELGGKNSTIVMTDADLEKAIPAIVQASFGNSGQVCTAPSRVLVHEGIVEEFGQLFAREVEKLRVGHGLTDGVDLGPVVSQRQLDSISAKLKNGIADGGQLLTGGKVMDVDGYFHEPTVVTNLGIESALAQEEIFGPIVNLIPFHSVDEAIRMSNLTSYGLTTQVWTRDISTAHQFANRLDSGSVWVNGKSMDIALPFGGFKESGWGAEKGREGIELYTRLKTVVFSL